MFHDLLIIGLSNATEAIAPSVAASRCFGLASLYPVPLTPAFATCITNAGRRQCHTYLDVGEMLRGVVYSLITDSKYSKCATKHRNVDHGVPELLTSGSLSAVD